MSTNISNITGNFFDAKISKSNLIDLLLEVEDDTPEICFLNNLKRNHTTIDKQGYISITEMSWCGEYSGNSYDLFIERVLPKIEGKMELFIIWEGGESIEGLRVENGNVTEHEVKFSLLD
jgi:hypothetical protein